jgi:transposase-like protein
MSRRDISFDKKIKAVEKNKRGEGSQETIACEYGVDEFSFRQW